MKKILLFCVVVAGVLACSKDKFKTEPQVEIKSLSPKEVLNKDIFTLRATVRDQEGDLKDSVKIVMKMFTPGVSVPLDIDTIRYSLGDFTFPNSSTIEVNLLFSYGEFRDGYLPVSLVNSDREFSVGLIVHDKAGNISEYKESEKIVLKKL